MRDRPAVARGLFPAPRRHALAVRSDVAAVKRENAHPKAFHAGDLHLERADLHGLALPGKAVTAAGEVFAVARKLHIVIAVVGDDRVRAVENPTPDHVFTVGEFAVGSEFERKLTVVVVLPRPDEVRRGASGRYRRRGCKRSLNTTV